MANELLVKKRIAAVKENMVGILRGLSDEFDRGLIKSSAELQHRVFHELQKFYDSIGSPTFTAVEAWGPPYSSDHNKMIEEILHDFNTLYAEAVNLTADIAENFEQVESERQSFEKRIADIEAYQQNIEASFSKGSDLLILRDDFRDIERFDRPATPGTPVYMSTDEGLITLDRTAGETYNEFATVTIIKGNGFPGNTHVIRSSGDSLRFDGEDDLHINLADLLDSNADTWLEYEMFELTQQGEDITENKDIRYNEPIKWADRDVKELRCVIQVDFPKSKLMNWISISPYIPSDRGALSATIEKVVVSDEQGVVSSMAFEENFDMSKAFIFSSQKCKTITIYLRQSTSYETQVGHFYFMEVNKEELRVMDESRVFDGTRIYAPSLPSVTNLGVSYDSGTEKIVYPITVYGDTISDIEAKKKNLFGLPQTNDSILAGLEQVPARRYALGLRDINTANYQFSMVSQYVSKPFVSSKPIKELQMDAIVDIPTLFPEDEDWVSFEFSVDDGQKWYPIHKKDSYREGAKTKYLFNTNAPAEGRLEECGYIESLVDIYEVRVRLTLKRPGSLENDFNYTPVVYSYELQAVTTEDVN